MTKKEEKWVNEAVKESNKDPCYICDKRLNANDGDCKECILHKEYGLELVQEEINNSYSVQYAWLGNQTDSGDVGDQIQANENIAELKKKYDLSDKNIKSLWDSEQKEFEIYEKNFKKNQ